MGESKREQLSVVSGQLSELEPENHGGVCGTAEAVRFQDMGDETAGPSTRTAMVCAVLAQDDKALEESNAGPSTTSAEADSARDDKSAGVGFPTLSQNRGKDGAPSITVSALSRDT